MKKPAISVIIGSFNQKECLEKVLVSLSNQTAPADEYEIVVVDSSSSDGSAQLLKEFKPSCHYQFKILPNEGKAFARNEAIKLAKGEIILITDADMIAHKELVKIHLNAHMNQNGAACFEGLTYNLKVLEWPTANRNLSPYIKKNYNYMAKLGWYYFLTGNLSLPRQLFLEELGFSQDFTGYGWEDIELGYRLFKKKIPLYYLNTAKNYHYHVLDPKDEISRCEAKGLSAKIFLHKHPELRLFLGINPLSVALFKIFNRSPKTISYIHKHCIHSKFPPLSRMSIWFLKEFYYLKGLLKKNDGHGPQA